MRHLHLDPVGGVAGDMFVAALLDAAPAQQPACLRAAALVAQVPCQLLRHHDDVLSGARFVVAPAAAGHAHAAWRDIRARLAAAPLDDAVRGHALGIFTLLAEAEARVHGIVPEDVAFHELGAADSMADIVAAAVLIAAQADGDGAASWSCAPLPLGGGLVRTAHGMLPVPAPATALLLEGFDLIDDGIGGERVTPTGAAILRHLRAHQPAPPTAQRLLATGIGFGTRSLPGRSNVLRALVLAHTPAAGSRELAVIGFEVDDQTAEDLAVGLDRIRAVPGVHDAVQIAGLGKKGRMVAQIQVLAAPEALEATVAACFRETSTIGLRTQIVAGRTLARHMAEVSVAGQTVRVKRVARPDGMTGKAESDDVQAAHGHAGRQQLRRAAEGLADE